MRISIFLPIVLLLLAACGSSSSDKPSTGTNPTDNTETKKQSSVSGSALTGNWVYEKFVTMDGKEADQNNPQAVENHNSSTGAYLLFNADNTYKIGRHYMGDELVAGEGRYKVEDNIIYLTDKSGHEVEHEIVQLTGDRLVMPFSLFGGHNIVYKKEK